MSTHVNGSCPYCHRDISFTWIYFSNTGGSQDTKLNHFYTVEGTAWTLGECPSCHKCALLELYIDQEDFLGHLQRFHLSKISPFPLPSPTNDKIPQIIKKAIDEAKLCLSIGAPMACATMCRRAIQCACIDKGATAGTELYHQIDELAKNGIITSQLKDWAHGVRWVGNDGAHPNNLEVNKEDAEDILDLSESLMDLLYVMPAIAKKHIDAHKK